MTTTNLPTPNKHSRLIIAVSILIPVVVALLFSFKLQDFGVQVKPLTFLPPIYAGINGITALLLIFGVVAIKKANRILHQKLMTAALGASVLFLVLYVAYHLTSPTTYFGDINHDHVVDAAEKAAIGILHGVYVFILLTHILLSIIIIPIVLFTFSFAWNHDFERHKKWAKYTFPLWLYVAVTGVVVYLMIAPYYVV
ncbi:MAG: hypothetical protein CFE24_11850 [Flavobacterium sp. BFFFF2]|nr:MAG: hypothetical protein CFE24_11850 [Flavobacterium sp. BFFFF2]